MPIKVSQKANQQLYNRIEAHFCHEITIARYGAYGENIAIECTDCNEIIIDVDRER